MTKRFRAILPALLILVFLIPAYEGGSAMENESGSCYVIGYGEADIPADPVNDGTLYVAGYRNSNPATGILDLQKAKALYIGTDSARDAVLLIVIDCVAISGGETERIRGLLKELALEHGIGSIHVIATHDHAGADTLGLWGPVGGEGKNPVFMEHLREACIRAAEQACVSRREGTLRFGSCSTAGTGIQEDTRLPKVYDPSLYCFLFEPQDGSAPIRLLNYATHAESLDGDNSLISADLPRYVADYLKEYDGGDTVWIPGAIGGLIRTSFVRTNRIENCKTTGAKIGGYAARIECTEILPPEIAITSMGFSAPCENPMFLLMKTLGVLEQRSHRKLLQCFIDSEMSLLRLGGKTILLVPGEIFPELVYGDNTGFPVHDPSKTLPPLTDVFGKDLLIFGLADDEIGYIVAPENFMLNRTKPYLDRIRDGNGEDHYEETNSLGPETARIIYETAITLKEQSGK